MKTPLVKSIMFYKNEDGTFANYLDVALTTNGLDEAFRLRMNEPMTVVDHGDRERGEMKLTRKLTDAEELLILLVLTCCTDYMEGRGPEELDYLTCMYIGRLVNHFDWEGAGYGPETEKGERLMELTDRIAHFECIG
jgi:hypothetical protein